MPSVLCAIRLPVVLTLLALASSANAGAQVLQAEPEIVGNLLAFGGSPRAELGRGINRRTFAGRATRCVSVTADPLTDQELETETGAKADLNVVTRIDELNQALGFDLRASYRSPVFSASASVALDKSIHLSSQTFTAVLFYSVNFTDLTGVPVSTKHGFDLRTEKGRSDFWATCGTYFISSVKRGTRLTAVLEITGVSSDIKSRLEAAMAADGTFTGTDRASLNVSFRDQLRSSAQQKRLRIAIARVGGGKFEDAVKSSIETNLMKAIIEGVPSQAERDKLILVEPEEALKFAIGPFLKDLNAAHATTVGATITPYGQIYPDLKLAAFDTADENLTLWYARHLQLQTVLNVTDDLVSERDRRWKILTAAARTSVESLRKTTTERLAAVRKAADQCVLEDRCIRPDPIALSDLTRGLPPLPRPPTVRIELLIDDKPASESDTQKVLSLVPNESLLDRVTKALHIAASAARLNAVIDAGGVDSNYDVDLYALEGAVMQRPDAQTVLHPQDLKPLLDRRRAVLLLESSSDPSSAPYAPNRLYRWGADHPYKDPGSQQGGNLNMYVTDSAGQIWQMDLLGVDWISGPNPTVNVRYSRSAETSKPMSHYSTTGFQTLEAGLVPAFVAAAAVPDQKPVESETPKRPGMPGLFLVLAGFGVLVAGIVGYFVVASRKRGG